MRHIKMFFKGMLLYSTTITIILYFCSLDSLIENPKYMLYGGYIILALLMLCYLFLSQKDLLILTFNKSK